jgi:predicted 3-demethylubiquinone-9 3-methyltransferase (glyoxalase superfamily)
MVGKNTICLWYDGTALEAARFYAETFSDSAVKRSIARRATFPPVKSAMS